MTKSRPLTIGVLTVPNRHESLVELGRSLETAVGMYDGAVEILVAGNNIEEGVSRLDSTLSCPVRYVPTDGTAPTGRNRLIAAADTRWLIFTDDDCQVDRYLLANHDSAIEEAAPRTAAVYGPLIFEGDRSRAFEAYRFTPFVHPLQLPMWRDRIDWGATANAAFDTEAVLDVGNFDQRIPVAVSGEDVDIGLKLRGEGYRTATAPSAVVYHGTESWNSVVGNIRRAYTYGRSEAWLVDRYPDRRTMFVNDPGTVRITTIATSTLGGMVSLVLMLLWPLTVLWRWGRTDPSTSLAAFGLADLYLVANTCGYIHQVFLGGDSWQQVLHRFRFYEHPYISSRIQQKGVWHVDDEDVVGDRSS